MTFRYRLLASYIFLITIPLLVLGTLFYRTSLQIITEQAQKNVYELVKKNNEVMDTKLRIVDQNSMSLFLDKDLFRIFNQLDPANEAGLFEADRQVTAILGKYFSQNQDIYAYQLWTSYFTFGQTLPQGDPTQSDIYEMALQAGGKLVWVPTYDFVSMFHQPYLQSGNLEFRYLFSATRVLDFTYLGNTKLEKMNARAERPVLAISFKSEVLKSLYADSISGSARYMVLDPHDKVVASSEPGAVARTSKEAWLDELKQERSGARRMTLDGEAVIVCFDRSEVTGWMSVVWIPEAGLLSSFVPVIRTSITVLAVVLGIAAFILAFFIAGKITKPIKRLLSAMRSVGEGDFQTRVEVVTNDEFGMLTKRFNRMNDRIHLLVTENYEIKLKEKEAEIQALTMQMHPHFLYNTLNVMNWTAIENGQQELSRMLVCLSNMLHYTSRKTWDAVHLSEEMNWMDNYFYIMSIRFEDKFTVEYAIDPQLYEYDVPRLLFQPFVENAILHGFNQTESGGMIRIRGWIAEGTRFYEVADNGRGMSQETVQAILYQKSSSVGIKNTIDRIQIAYGTLYGVSIVSAPGEGTRVVITLPV
ncbi:cache domain-containing sensor histidine kinase [Paenibacillus riograndensis]|uniref:Sensor with HAMP domain n=1 Tax=Paenibacillus riograndensis SBR5 TaxID=1073571 RepID=A0A0E3WGD3_9BACL|nr:sensor histidine kinase [Paenibacillus riograndensis]CQR52596.1 sensor with HAMP domain [Paenibacillus riograndensis SBR5]